MFATSFDDKLFFASMVLTFIAIVGFVNLAARWLEERRTDDYVPAHRIKERTR